MLIFRGVYSKKKKSPSDNSVSLRSASQRTSSKSRPQKNDRIRNFHKVVFPRRGHKDQKKRQTGKKKTVTPPVKINNLTMNEDVYIPY